jgi:hypothetical protein
MAACGTGRPTKISHEFIRPQRHQHELRQRDPVERVTDLQGAQSLDAGQIVGQHKGSPGGPETGVDYDQESRHRDIGPGQHAQMDQRVFGAGLVHDKGHDEHAAAKQEPGHRSCAVVDARSFKEPAGAGGADPGPECRCGRNPGARHAPCIGGRASSREVRWIHGARHDGEHPFAAETRALLKALPRGYRHIRYSSPRPGNRLAVDFDAPGRSNMQAVKELGVPRDADFYL